MFIKKISSQKTQNSSRFFSSKKIQKFTENLQNSPPKSLHKKTPLIQDLARFVRQL
jgi:hypothetical protein